MYVHYSEEKLKEIKVTYSDDFKVLIGNEKSQSAIMVLPPKGNEGGPDNKHKNSDQWLYVTSGKGSATVDGTEVELLPGCLILIEKGEIHEIRNTGEVNLNTINFYVPPEY